MHIINPFSVTSKLLEALLTKFSVFKCFTTSLFIRLNKTSELTFE